MTIKIHSPMCVRLAAGHLRAQLERLGYTAQLVDDIHLCDESLYIIYAAGTVRTFPKNYIVYQTEVSTSEWFNKKYLEAISKALCVWEYSESNIPKYQKHNNKIAVVTPGVSILDTPYKDGGILFYGWITGSKRREVILKQLSAKVKIDIVTNKLGGEMWWLLSRARVVLNLHYYEHAPIEAFRINEALSFNCHVVSENSTHGDDGYKGLVHFSKIDEMAEKLIELNNKPFDLNVSRLNNLKEIKKAMQLVISTAPALQSSGG